jgi:hypothetical protein
LMPEWRRHESRKAAGESGISLRWRVSLELRKRTGPTSVAGLGFRMTAAMRGALSRT